MDDIPITIEHPEELLQKMHQFKAILLAEEHREEEAHHDLRNDALRTLDKMLLKVRKDLLEFGKFIGHLHDSEHDLLKAETQSMGLGIKQGFESPEVAHLKQEIHTWQTKLGGVRLDLVKDVRRTLYLLQKVMEWQAHLKKDEHIQHWFRESLKIQGVHDHDLEDSLDRCLKAYTKFSNHIIVIGGFLHDLHNTIMGTVKHSDISGKKIVDGYDLNAKRIATHIVTINDILRDLRKIIAEQKKLAKDEQLALHAIDHTLKEVVELEKNLRKHDFITRADWHRFAGQYHTKYRL
jgi:hypothetical protein